MKRILTFLFAIGLSLMAGSIWASDTSKIVATRLANSADITPGRWHRSFTKAKAWAVANGVPFVAVWSNGENCPHCVKFENCCNQTVFKNWMADSGVVFWFGYSGDSEYPVGCTAFHWARNNKNTSYPFVRIYWPAGKVDIATTGDGIEGYTSGTTGAKKVVAYFKSKLSKWSPVDKNLPYTIAFDANLPAGYVPEAGDVTEMASVETTYSDTITAKSTFALTDYACEGWSLTASGAVKYKDGASLTKLTTTSNATVTLYAQWVCSPYAIELDPNFTGEGDVPQTVTLKAEYDKAVTLPSTPFTRADYAFAGWATTPTGSVVYKDAASVKFATKTDVVTLYAKWTKITYRTYYVGKKYSISTGLKGYVAKTTFAGMTWNKTTGVFAGTPKTANATDPKTGTGLKVKFVKGSTTVYRFFVVVKDALSLESDALTGSTAEFTTSDDDVTFAATAVSGALSNVTVANLPSGMTYSAATGLISGRPTATGTYFVKVTGTGASGLSLSTTYKFVVTEGNQLVLGNFVHADKMFVEAGAELDLALDFADKDNNPYTIYLPSSGVTVKNADKKVVDATVSTLKITQDETTGDCRLTGAIAKAGTYTMTITLWSDDNAYISQNLMVVVVAAQDE